MEDIKENDDNVVKVDMKNVSQPVEDDVTKLDLSKPPVSKAEENTDEEKPVENDGADEARVGGSDESAVAEEKQEEVPEETEAQETTVLEEVTEEDEVVEETVEDVAEQIEEVAAEAESTGQPLPENI
ncbi:MAG: hypothetical protein EBY39_13140, partial [Flavobacteriia bacterium]|nr:hypothetical protein [Flavobacteriia bacterium]